MAITEAKVFVNEWKYKSGEPNPAWGMKVAEPHSKKVGEDYEPVGTTRWTVKNGWDSEAGKPTEFDFSVYQPGDRLLVKGVQVTERTTSNEKTYDNLVLKVVSVERIDGGKPSVKDAWVEVSEPF